MVLQVDIEEILFAESRTIAIVDFTSKRNIIYMQNSFQATLFHCSLVLYSELWGQHMAVGPCYTVYTTNVMRITYRNSIPYFWGKMYLCR